jgi:hypothetical protein
VKKVVQFVAYRNATRDQARPMRLEYVLGLRISLRHTMISIRRVITLAGGICCAAEPAPPPPSSFARSSAVEHLDPSFVSCSGPAASPASASSAVVLPPDLKPKPSASPVAVTAAPLFSFSENEKQRERDDSNFAKVCVATR